VEGWEHHLGEDEMSMSAPPGTFVVRPPLDAGQCWTRMSRSTDGERGPLLFR